MTTIPEYAKGGIVSGADFGTNGDEGKEVVKPVYRIDGVPLPTPVNKDFEPEYLCKWITEKDIDTRVKRLQRP